MAIHRVVLDLHKVAKIDIELDDTIAPKTVKAFLSRLPLEAAIHIWGEELYTEDVGMKAGHENQKPLVQLYDVAFWPPGRAVCLFFGPTPVGSPGEIRPYSPVNVIGRITGADPGIVKKVKEGTLGTFRLA